MIVMATPQDLLLKASIDNVKSTQFVAHESGSVLKGFTRQFRIVSKNLWIQAQGARPRSGRFGWREFMEKVKPEVSRIMRDNRQTKIKMILSCKMVREYEMDQSSFKINFFTPK